MTEVNLMKQTVFQNLFSNLEDHIESYGNIEQLLIKMAHFHMHHFF